MNIGSYIGQYRVIHTHFYPTIYCYPVLCLYEMHFDCKSEAMLLYMIQQQINSYKINTRMCSTVFIYVRFQYWLYGIFKYWCVVFSLCCLLQFEKDSQLNLKQCSLAWHHALFTGRHALFSNAMPFSRQYYKRKVFLLFVHINSALLHTLNTPNALFGKEIPYPFSNLDLTLILILIGNVKSLLLQMAVSI